jgi:hypothetical protein
MASLGFISCQVPVPKERINKHGLIGGCQQILRQKKSQGTIIITSTSKEKKPRYPSQKKKEDAKVQ